MAGNALAEWVGVQLSKLLGFDASGDFASYLLSMETKADLEDYLQELLNRSNPKHEQFVQELLRKWKSKCREVEQSVPEGVVVYKKEADEEITSTKVIKVNNARNKTNIPEEKTAEQLSHTSPDSQPAAQPEKKSPVKSSPAQKTKFVPLFDPEGRDRSITKIPGRHPCICQAHKHGLINNCLNCGRVVCKQEGSGPCVFCGTLVCTEEERESISRGSKKGDKLYESLMKGSAVPKFPPQQIDDVLATKAKEHKDRLLHYDKTSARRTKVIDDESDYYATESKWLSNEDRDKLQKKKDVLHAKKHASRRDKTITFDFAGRRLLDSTFDTKDLEEALNADSSFGEDITNIHKEMNSRITPSYLSPSHRPQFQQDVTERVSTAKPTVPTSKRTHLRLQDKGLQEVVDSGMCMSMHQPWASLLVAGIKVHEGRTWYSAHRGRLWIAATAQTPTDLEIQSLEHSYTQLLGPNLSFPEVYPVGCLLGCVDVVDALAQEDYRQQFAAGESTSPYVFICEHPQELPLKFPIKGQHKIYTLDPDLHKAARMGL